MSRSRTDAQNAFHERLTRYVNGTFDSRGTLILSLLAPGAAYQREAAQLCEEFPSSAQRTGAEHPAQR